MVISTDSYVVDPPIFPGGDIGKLAISGTVNDLLASGAIPHYLTFSLIISEGFPHSALKCILDSAQQTAQAADVKVVAGDTKVLGKQNNVGIYINTTGLGIPIKSGKNYAVSNACPEDSVIVTGTLGDHGMAVLSAREGLGFEHRILSDCAPLHELMIPLLKACDEIRCLRDPTRGGVIGALIDITESSRVDVFVDEDAIPLKNEVRFGSEMLGLDPLSLVNEGKMIIVVSAAETEKVLAQLRQHPLGKASNVIGVIQKAHAPRGQLILKKGGTRRVVVRPEGQILPRLC
jgi:hydrogenase expression/formation protein HypE